MNGDQYNGQASVDSVPQQTTVTENVSATVEENIAVIFSSLDLKFE